MQYSQSSLKFSSDAQGHITSKPDECYMLMHAKDELWSSSLLYTRIVKKEIIRTIIFLSAPAGKPTCSSSIVRLTSCNNENHGNLTTATNDGRYFSVSIFHLGWWIINTCAQQWMYQPRALVTKQQLVQRRASFFFPLKMYFYTQNCSFDLTNFFFQA